MATETKWQTGNLSIDAAMSRIKKLLALATSDNLEEAAHAASLAAGMMSDYQISEAALSFDDSSANETATDEYFDVGLPGKDRKRAGKKIHWRFQIIAGCAAVCNTSPYWHDAEIRLLGRPADIQATRYLFDLISLQVEQTGERCFAVFAYEEYGAFGKPEFGEKRQWMHAFRLGCSRVVRQRMIDEHENKIAQQARDTANAHALVVIDRRLAKIEELKRPLGLKPINAAPRISNNNAYSVGKREGANINTANRTGITGGRLALKG